jgi:hypothetical protein
MKAIRVALVAFFFIRVLMGDIPLFDGLFWIDAIAACGLIVILAIQFHAVRGVFKRRNLERAATPRFKGKPKVQLISDDDFDLQRHYLRKSQFIEWVSRRSKVELLWCIPKVLLAYLLFLGAVALLIVEPQYLLLTTPHIAIERFGIDIPSYPITVSIWCIPMAFALRFLYTSARPQQEWKWRPVYIVDDIHLIERNQESGLLPEEGRLDPHIPLNQIVEVWAVVGYWGGMMRGFGELHYMRRISDEKDIEREFVISHLPQVEKLAELLRDHPNCPAGRSEEDQSGEAARIP